MQLKNNVLLIVVFTFLFAFKGNAQKSSSKKEKTKKDNSETVETPPPTLSNVFKPTLGLGTGTLSYFGNIYSKGHHFQSFTQSRIGYNLNITQPLNEFLNVNFYVMFGKLGADERSSVPDQNKNFQSQISMGGLQLLYDFSNYIKKQNDIRPYILAGIEGFEFLSKTDMYDRHGNKYYYWNDGTIRNMAQGEAGAQNATKLIRDYTYETDIRQLNQNGFGNYNQYSLALPVGAGVTVNAGDHIKFRVGATMHFTFTNKIDGVGSTKNDNFLMVAVSAHYDLADRISQNKHDTLPRNHYKGVDYLALDNADEDGDGVKDLDDLCHGTPAGAKVDAKGCPIDDDKDLVPDYKDEEIPTDTGKVANQKGIAMTDADFQSWYDNYYDSTGRFAKVVYLSDPNKKGSIKSADPAKQPKEYSVELVRYHGGIPADEMAYLLSIGDVKSFNIGDTTVVYTAGSYEDVRKAVARRDEYRAEGLKSAKVGYFKGENYFTMSDSELEKEVNSANKKGKSQNENVSVPVKINDKGLVYRVQLGAYKSKLSPSMFKHAGKVVELKTEDGYYKYASGAFKTITDAAAHKAELVYEGYEDAFITAYFNGKRIPLNKAGATYEDTDFKEDLNENAHTGSTIDKSLVNFKIQLGPLRKFEDKSLDEQLKELKDVDKEPTTTGMMRITAGEFKNIDDAKKYKEAITAKGITGAFIIATFKGEVISMQEAMELLK